MKQIAVVLALVLTCGEALAQHHPHADQKPATLTEGLGKVRHPVSTTNAEAQRFFDQGLAYIYAFNHEESARSFKRAAELDPELAMAYWGVALAIGPNYNLDVDMEREKAAHEAIQKARSLASKASDKERAYIEALAKRYTDDPKPDFKKLAVDYKNAMGELKNRYPDDLDAATLYAESMMNLRPWRLWSADGKPAEGTEEIVSVLESVLKRDPHHTGANHYYIHAVEASPNPERALESANRLGTLAPSAGHLVHMPSHIFIRVGDYNAAALSNVAGAEADRAYIKATGAAGLYPLMYYSHNLHFLAIAYDLDGRYKDALKAADDLSANVAPHVKQMAMLEVFLPTSIIIQVRFRRWDDVLKSPEPDRSAQPVTNALWHFARGFAYAATGKVDSAEAEFKIFTEAEKNTPADAAWGFTTAGNILKIAEHMLAAKITAAKGDRGAAIELLKQALAIEDKLPYNEPPDWNLPVRESLGGLLLSGKNYKEAEQVFREDLRRHPRSGRALFGLAESLKAQGKKSDAQAAKKDFDEAWKRADTRLRIEDL